MLAQLLVGICLWAAHVEASAPQQFDHPSGLTDQECTMCHAEASAFWERSVHARQEQPVAERVEGAGPAGCVDCHGDPVLPASNPASAISVLKLPDTCGRCHRPPDTTREPGGCSSGVGYEASGHAKELREHGLAVTATCVSCHGSHEILPPDDEAAATSRGRVPELCGSCHLGILLGYREGAHGTAFAEGTAAVPVCTDCHGEHAIHTRGCPDSPVSHENVAATCASCHADVAVIGEFALSDRAMESYARSYHGVASGLGERGAANCASCHGYHAIYPSDDPRSRVHPDRLEETCGGCHQGAGVAFSRAPVHSIIDVETNAVSWWVRKIYLILISGIIGLFLLFIAIDLFGELRRNRSHRDARERGTTAAEREIAPDGTVLRMSLRARLQHLLLVVSFLLLVLTGLPLLLSDVEWVRRLFGFDGAFAIRSFLHRVGAVSLLVLSLWHLLGIRRLQGRQWLSAILIRPVDLVRFWHELAWNLGLRKQRPNWGRYTFAEKLEYLAVVWGNAVMILSGVLLWRPDWFLGRMPAWVFDLGRVVHGYEAVLAFLAILVWHMYQVHLRPGTFPMSRVWLSGRMPVDELRRHHPGEYRRLFLPDGGSSDGVEDEEAESHPE